MSPLEEAWHDWPEANGADGGTGLYRAFEAGWHARDAEIDTLTARRDTDANFWRRRIESADAERDRALMLLATTEYERAAYRRQRDELARALTAAHKGAP